MTSSTLISNPGTGGYTFASDKDGSSIYWPYTKMAFGADGTQTLVTSTNALPVAINTTVTYTITNPTVTTSTTALLASNASAKYRFIQNTTSTGAWMNIGASAAVGTGIYLGPNGSFEMSSTAGNLDTRAINAISTSGSILFSVSEGV